MAIEQSQPAGAVVALLAPLGEHHAAPPIEPGMPVYGACPDRDEADGV